MVFAQIKDNTIKNVIELDDITLVPLFNKDFQGNDYDAVVQIDGINPQPGINWTFDNINWHAPEIIEVPISKTPTEIYTSIVIAAQTFGQQLITQFAVANVMTGITQAGKTQAMLDYSNNLYLCLSTGSLYAAIDEINALIADTSSEKSNLYPFITDSILTGYKNQIQTYLHLPLT